MSIHIYQKHNCFINLLHIIFIICIFISHISPIRVRSSIMVRARGSKTNITVKKFLYMTRFVMFVFSYTIFLTREVIKSIIYDIFVRLRCR